MSKIEKTESVLILVFSILLLCSVNALPASMSPSRLVLYSAGLLLAQGLIRDLWIVFSTRHATRQDTRAEQCFCVESTIGFTGILAGALLFLLGYDTPIPITQIILAMSFIGVLVIGFVIKDFVIAWRPWRIYREKNHLNIILRWR